MTQTEYLQRFEEITNQMLELTKRKNSDYANVDDAFANFRLCENLGITSLPNGILVRMTDKLQRIANLLKREAQVTDEKIEDTVTDMAVYAIILLVYLHGQKSLIEPNKDVRRTNYTV